MKPIKIIYLIALFSSLLFAKNLEKVSIQLQWLDQFQFAGYYIAKEKGYYKDVGLDVELLKYSNNINIVDDVLKGKTTFATGRTSLLIHRNNNHPVVVLSAIFQYSPEVLLVIDKDISVLKDLINKKIMITQDAIASASYISMLFSEGVIKENIHIQKHSFNIEDLINGTTDAMASYISNEPYILDKRNIKYKYFHPKDYGFDFYGDLLYTSEHELKTNPKRVENFTLASLKGWNYAFKNIEETARIIYEKYNSQKKSIEQLIYEGQALKTLAYDKKNKLGYIDKEKFKDIAQTYRLLGLLKKDFNLDDFIYNIHHLKTTSLTKDEQNWLRNNPVIKLGTNKEWNPIEFFNDGTYSGIASGYLELIERKLNIKLDTQNTLYWHEMLQKIKNKEIDLFLAAVKTPNRDKYLNFTKPYLEFPTIIVTRDDKPYIRNINQLSNKKVVVEKGFYTEELIKNLNKKIKIITTNTTKEALKKVYEGSAFAYIGSLPSSGYFIKKLKYTNLKINGEAPFKTTLSFATRKDLPIFHSILKKTLNSILQEEHDEIYNKWLSIKYEKEIDYTILSLIIIIVLLIITSLYLRNRTLKTISETDSLTLIANRRKIDSFLDIEIERSQRNQIPVSIIMVDIDFFKQVNDNYGHRTGDKVLKIVANILKSNIRKYDLVGRWGGEEFILICPDSNLNQALFLARKIKHLIENTKIKALKNNNITISCGVAQYKTNDSISRFISKADEQLYKAKENGRNCIYPKI